MAELALSIAAADYSVVLTLRDRFEFQNRTRVALQWRQAGTVKSSEENTVYVYVYIWVYIYICLGMCVCMHACMYVA